jgi:hypothetical protein
MLEQLQFNLEEGTIPYCFDHQCNILWDMGDQKKTDSAKYLKKVIRNLRQIMSKEKCYLTWTSYLTRRTLES